MAWGESAAMSLCLFSKDGEREPGYPHPIPISVLVLPFPCHNTLPIPVPILASIAIPISLDHDRDHDKNMDKRTKVHELEAPNHCSHPTPPSFV